MIGITFSKGGRGLRALAVAAARRRLLAPLCALMLAAMPAAAQQGLSGAGLSGEGLAGEGLAGASLLPGWRAEGGAHFAALQLDLAPGWKTYWRSPGDTGLPPQFDWSGSENLGAVTVHWPRPRVYDADGLRTIGYAHQVVLPLEVTPRDPARPVMLRARIDLGVCQDVCLPVTLALTADLPDRAGPADPRILAALAAVPEPAAAHGLDRHICRVEPRGRGLRLTADLTLPDLGGPTTAVIEAGSPDLWVSEPEVTREGGRLIARSDVMSASRGPILIDRGGIVITLIAGERALEVRGCPAP